MGDIGGFEAPLTLIVLLFESARGLLGLPALFDTEERARTGPVYVPCSWCSPWMSPSLSPLKEPSLLSSYSSSLDSLLPNSRVGSTCTPLLRGMTYGKGGSSWSSSSLSSSLSSMEEAISAFPLNASSRVDVEVRPCVEKLDASPRRISWRATSSSEMTLILPRVGSGVGMIPPLAPTCRYGVYCAEPRVRERYPCTGPLEVEYGVVKPWRYEESPCT